MLGASVIALTNLPIGTSNPLLGLPPSLAVSLVAVLIAARWWLLLRNK